MIHEYLTTFSKASLAIWLVVLLTTPLCRYLCAEQQFKRSSFEPVLLITMLMATFQIGWELFCGKFFAYSSMTDLVRAMWYFGFAISDWALLFIILWALKRFSLCGCRATDTILIAYAVMGFLQLSRYCDRYILETDLLGYIYKNGIPAINCIITIVIIWQGIVICHGLLKSTREVS